MIRAVTSAISRGAQYAGQWTVDFVLDKLVPEHHDYMVRRRHEIRQGKMEERRAKVSRT